jgi:hypothetical protein
LEACQLRLKLLNTYFTAGEAAATDKAFSTKDFSGSLGIARVF